ncbi:MAG: flavin reductase family protein, partial [Desulfovibrionaceae bacterium]|nr:flavin reductase family protein [Desulfovibrionaceae bacterium]
MKKNIGSVMGLYPTPLAVVGAMVLGRVNWVLVGHLGIMGHDRVMISLAKPHFTNQGILESGLCSVNIVDEAMLPQADEAGRVSGAKTDKSGLFAWHAGEAGAPVADA